MDKSKKQKVWIVAAGTGGHIFPGITLAHELKKTNPHLDFLFFGTRDRLEARLIPEAGFAIHFLRASQWKGRAILARFQTLFDLGVGFFQVLTLALKTERPVCLIGVGGYVSVPVSLVAVLLRVPFFIVEPNICAGISNRLLSRFARLAFTVPGADAFKKFRTQVIDAGNPTRPGLSPIAIKPQVTRILVLGGSQGAARLTHAMLAVCRELPLEQHSIWVTIQSGDKNFEEALSLHKTMGLGKNVNVLPFISDVPSEIMLSDLVVSRAGAMSVAEFCVAGIPAIFVPFPFAADDHQKKNAALLQNDGAARMVLEGDAFEERLGKEVRELCVGPNQEKLRRTLGEKMKTWGRPNATQTIAQKIMGQL